MSLFTGLINRAGKRTEYSVKNYFPYVTEDSSSKVVVVLALQRVLRRGGQVKLGAPAACAGWWQRPQDLGPYLHGWNPVFSTSQRCDPGQVLCEVAIRCCEVTVNLSE